MYIEREAFVKYIRSREGNFIDDMGKGWSNGMAAAASMCEKFPAADVVEVVHGEWIEGENWSVTCSVCGCLAIAHDGKNYCPNCGAKMDGGKPDEEL